MAIRSTPNRDQRLSEFGRLISGAYSYLPLLHQRLHTRTSAASVDSPPAPGLSSEAERGRLVIDADAKEGISGSPYPPCLPSIRPLAYRRLGAGGVQ